MNFSYENIYLVSKRSFQLSAVLVLGMVLYFGALLLYEKRQEFHGDKELVAQIYHKLYEEKLLADLTFEVELIDRLRRDTRKRMESNLIAESEKVLNLVHSRYAQSSDTTLLGRESAIIEELRRINSDGQSRKVFVFQKSDGKILLYPRIDSLEGKNIISDFSSTQQKSFLALIKAVGTAGNQPFAYTSPTFTTEESLFPPTLTYVNNFSTLGWIIGVDDFYASNESELQERVRQNLSEIRGNSRIGLYELSAKSQSFEDALLIISGGDASLGTTLSMLFEGENKQQNIDSLASALRTTKKFMLSEASTSMKPGRISVFYAYPEWNWILTKSISLEELSKETEKIEGERNAEMHATIKHVVITLLGTALLFLLIAYRQSKRLRWLVAGLLEQKSTYIEELKLENEVLDEKTHMDQLTHLHNRDSFDEKLAVEIERHRRYGHPLTLIIMDIDNFKGLNDTYGHLYGDKVLQLLSTKTTDNIRSADSLYRWGGDEFSLIVPEATLEGALLLAEKLRSLVADLEFPGEVRLTCSFGVALCNKDDTSDELFTRADTMLLKAKKAGKNQVCSSLS